MTDKAPPVTGTSSADEHGAPLPPGSPPLAISPPRVPEEERPVYVGHKAATTERIHRALTLDEVGPFWDRFRAGDVVECPADAGSLALNVDGNNAYRLVCCQCGTASSWFEAAPAGIRLRTVPPGPDEETADI